MSAHTVPTTAIAFRSSNGGMKQAVLALTLSASYDAGGSVADFSTAGNLGAALGFTTVTGVSCLGHETAASSKYYPVFVPAASNAPSTCLIKLHDLTAGSDAEPSGDLHASVMRILVVGT